MASSPCTAAGAAVGASPAHPACPLWQVIEALGQAISRTPGCVLLDVDAGASTNRTVYTFVGTPEAVVEGALSAARVAGQLIDMSQHTGEQPSAPSLGRAPASAGRKSRHRSAARGQAQSVSSTVGGMLVRPHRALAHPPDPEGLHLSCPEAGAGIAAANSTFLAVTVLSLQKQQGKGSRPSLSACPSGPPP